MSRAKDMRDRLIDAAVRFSTNELAIRSMTKRMHASACESSPPCWAQDPREVWKDPQAELPDSYCEACERATILRRERHALKARRRTKKETLLKAVAIFNGSIYAACGAGPAAGRGGQRRSQKD